MNFYYRDTTKILLTKTFNLIYSLVLSFVGISSGMANKSPHYYWDKMVKKNLKEIKFYKSNSKALIKVEDIGISYENKGNSLYFPWNQIKKVTRKGNKVNLVLDSLVIRNKENQKIVIGAEIGDFSKLHSLIRQHTST